MSCPEEAGRLCPPVILIAAMADLPEAQIVMPSSFALSTDTLEDLSSHLRLSFIVNQREIQVEET